MWEFIKTIFGGLASYLGQFLVPLLTYYQGRQNHSQKVSEETIKDVIKQKEIENSNSRLSNDSVLTKLRKRFRRGEK